MEYVNHPNHYNLDGRRECIVELEEDYGCSITRLFCATNAYKYLYRAGNKSNNSKEQDLAKAQWYMEYYFDLVEKEQAPLELPILDVEVNLVRKLVEMIDEVKK